MRDAGGSSFANSSTCFPAISPVGSHAIPVTLPPGQARLEMYPLTDWIDAVGHDNRDFVCCAPRGLAADFLRFVASTRTERGQHACVCRLHGLTCRGSRRT